MGNSVGTLGAVWAAQSWAPCGVGGSEKGTPVTPPSPLDHNHPAQVSQKRACRSSSNVEVLCALNTHIVSLVCQPF